MLQWQHIQIFVMDYSGYIDLKKLSLDELTGVINLYPWFGAARKELCARMLRFGGDWGETQFADAAMYVPCRRSISDLVRSVKRVDCSDKDLSEVIQMCLSENGESVSVGLVAETEPAVPSKRQIRVVGGDYFTQSEYDRVKKNEDGVFSRFAAKARQDMSPEEQRARDLDFCTETLAGIYLEQGYYDYAIKIYEKLILAYPEKNAYFAALIEKLEKINN